MSSLKPFHCLLYGSRVPCSGEQTHCSASSSLTVRNTEFLAFSTQALVMLALPGSPSMLAQ